MTPRQPRLPPRDVPADFYRRFGDLDPELAVKVAEYVDWEKRRLCVEVVLLEIGSWPGFGFGLRKGFKLLKAGRYVVHRRKTACSNRAAIVQGKRRFSR